MKYVVVTAARDEAGYIEHTIKSLTSQTVKPIRWIIVDDGSTDGTVELVEAAAAQNDWITVIRRENRGFRSVGVGNYDALQEGFRAVANIDHDFLSIVDADVDFAPTYFEELGIKFSENPKLGIGCGAVIDILDGAFYKADILPEMTGGPLKCYRCQCWEEIGGLVRAASWDAIDCFKAMQLGWISQTFQEKSLNISHLRPTGSTQNSIFTGKKRRGAGMYFMGAHPVWVVASALRRFFEPPVAKGCWFVLVGYFQEMWRGGDQLKDQDLITYIRRWQLKRLGRAVFTLGASLRNDSLFFF